MKNITKLITKLKTTKSRRNGTYSANKLRDFKMGLKRFYFSKFKIICPEIANLLKIRESKANKRSEDFSQSEVMEILASANSLRDKFLIALARFWMQGIGVSEIVN
ncbi:hypothetical protein ACNF42_05905 [Cuniculiplasma sp. SKW3]|uniref:hypothetical protein n=1 Tax=Cuniculiplasma sp. SKW3 TaxID=3400170 RepID=UPI003FD14C0F